MPLVNRFTEGVHEQFLHTPEANVVDTSERDYEMLTAEDVAENKKKGTPLEPPLTHPLEHPPTPGPIRS
jgi:hypothetical protein